MAQKDPLRGKQYFNIWEWGKAIAIAIGIVLIVRGFFFTPTLVSGSSMEPNFSNGERIIVNKMIYLWQEPQRGDVIVFHAPDGKDYIKRIIALPGETVMVYGDDVTVDGRLLHENYLQEVLDDARKSGTSYNKAKHFQVTPSGIEPETVPEGHYFVMGDNRSHSIDSRYESVGFIPIENILGRAELVIWPLSDIRFVSNDVQFQ